MKVRRGLGEAYFTARKRCRKVRRIDEFVQMRDTGGEYTCGAGRGLQGGGGDDHRAGYGGGELRSGCAGSVVAATSEPGWRGHDSSADETDGDRGCGGRGSLWHCGCRAEAGRLHSTAGRQAAADHLF